ncbi:MAG: hypothetical protein J6S60_03910 [Oscillospiraceae bacterium]|nr:hypothetical protein [Oscillospiraceae bacterium]
MAEKPILFNTEMVRAILDGRKTVTRRIIMPQPDAQLCYAFAGSSGMPGTWGYPSRDAWEMWGEKYKLPDGLKDYDRRWKAPCRADDILWVRETWCRWWMLHGEWHYCYKASNPNGNKRPTGPEYDDDWETCSWRPSIHMPREAARLFLRVREVHVERLQEMTAKDSLSEGVKLHLGSIMEGNPVLRPFAEVWDSTIKKADVLEYGWDANPWVWVIKFERLDGKPAGLWADRDTAQWADQDVLMPAT